MKKLSKKEIDDKISEMQKGIKDGSIKIELAEASEIEQIEKRHPAYLEHFFKNVLKMNYWDCMITDRSSLRDFPESPKVYLKRIKKNYGIDIDPKNGLYIHQLIFEVFPRY